MDSDKKTSGETSPELTDHSDLINNVFELIENPENNFKKFEISDFRECDRIGYRSMDNKKKFASIVMAEDTAIELGSPEHKSVSNMLWTKKKGIVKEGIWISGRDFPEISEGSVSFSQTVIIELDYEADPTDIKLQSLKNLSNRIPGYMTRSVPGKIWIRIHRELMDKGFTLHALCKCLGKTYRDNFPKAGAISICLVADMPELVFKFEEIHNISRVISGENKKLQLEADGTISCDDLDCNSCDEQVYCDTIRDVIVKRRKNNE